MVHPVTILFFSANSSNSTVNLNFWIINFYAWNDTKFTQ